MNASQGTDQVERYLRELSAALSAMPEPERAEVVSGIREHIDASLPDQPTDANIERVLRDLGDPLAIAAEAGGGPQARMEPKVPLLQRRWVPPATALPPVGGVLFFWLGVTLLLSLGSLVLLWASPLWRVGEKILGTFVFAVLPPVLLALGAMAARPSDARCDGIGVDSVTVECAGDVAQDVLPVALPGLLYVLVVIGTAAFLWWRGAARARVSAQAAGRSARTAAP
ncbi:MAG TPA: hypothetical protein VHI11_11865 [Jiangellaceae bacterium]|jgi:hypothetical protein|nr:hypothetical protein [Jiangellaceae bacterium]